MEENKVKSFVKKHEKAFVVTGCLLVGIAGGRMLKNSSMKVDKLESGMEKLDLDKLGLLGRVVKVEEASRALAWMEDDAVDIADIEFCLADLGKVGEDLLKQHTEIFKPEDKISGILIYTK